MPGKEYSEGKIIVSSNDIPAVISLVADGEVEGVFGSHTFTLGKSDAIGICDLLVEKGSINYTAASNVNLYEYPCSGIEALDALIRSNADIAYLMVSSVCNQAAELFLYRERLTREVVNIVSLIKETYAEYSQLCGEYSVQAKRLAGINDIEPFSGEDPIQPWEHDLYVEIGALDPASRKAFFYDSPGIIFGFMQRSKNSLAKVVEVCELYHEYINGISPFLLNDNGFDLFAFVCDLHINTLNIEGADSRIEPLVVQLSDALSTLTGINSKAYNSRLYAYWDKLEEVRSGGSAEEPSSERSAIQSAGGMLAGAVETILEYAGADEELCEIFSNSIKAYTGFPDRNDSEDEVYDTRRALTKSFYEVYKLVLRKSIDATSVPTIINMFLNFGFVDAELAGAENADFLYSIADTYKGVPEKGIFTVREWLTSIYRGEREPSLSEFDMDYQTFLRDQKNQKLIDAAEEKRLLADQEEKLKYEMENCFPVVNRVTFGNPTRFCPTFSDHNVVRDLEKTLVTAADVENIINEVRNTDFSAFYRDIGFTDQKLGITGESISLEVVPNIVLMPNVGLRGSMWQEIEGRIRTTPGRMFLPVFLENELAPTVIKLVADFRWEMCKRVQGSRWNDMTDPSLTSYFCDYLQFYMNNRSLAMQTMNEIRNELSAARNNYKTVFVNNYLFWIQNEAKGMARLNGAALAILMTFCPFTAEIRDVLKNNMRYNEALTRYNTKRQRRTQRLTLLVKKITQNGKKVPQEILDELEYSRR
ncbi:MAG: hypothetical protein FWC20_07210 [Oscillospiraceae bacterium]|nr:hypothetical protein [Oscillospiraceae bacterium]MCL2279177.1 hypothetical protein [Oscillospiraceae bacterium]